MAAKWRNVPGILKAIVTETRRPGFVAAKGGAKGLVGSMFQYIFFLAEVYKYEIYKSLLCRYTDIYLIYIYTIICIYIYLFKYVYMSMYCLGYG